MHRMAQNCNSLSGFRRIRLLVGKFAFLVLAALAASAAWGDGWIYIEDNTAEGFLNANHQLVVKCGLGYLDASKTRVWDFNVSYGIVGGSWSTNLTMHTTPALGETWYFMADGENVPSFVSEPIPGYQAGDDVWYQVVVSNTLYNGSAPVVGSADDLTYVHDVHYVHGAYNSVDISYDYTWDTKNFIYKGKVDAYMAYASVRLTCGLNVASLDDNPMVLTANLDANGEFSITIPNAVEGDTLRWKLELIDGNGDATLYEDYLNRSEFTKKFELVDQGRVTYTWTGNGDGRSWADVDNWDKDVGLCKGYPGVKNGYYWDVIQFTTDADVDLGGQTYGVRDEGGHFITSAGINLTLRNGLLDLNHSSYTLGGSGTTLTFDRFAVIRGSTTSTSGFTVDFAAGTTVNFIGTKTSNMQWKPTKANVNFTFRDGTIKTRYSTSTSIQSTTRTLITNAIWQTTNGDITKRTGYMTTFRDGPDRQAQFICNAAIDLYGWYNVKIPAEGHSKPTIQAKTLNGTTTTIASFIVYVDDYLSDKPVPLVNFTATASTDKNNNTSRINTQIANTSGNNRIILYARTGDDSNYKDVTAKRNARLVWDSTAQTLYYQQDKVPRPTMIFLQ